VCVCVCDTVCVRKRERERERERERTMQNITEERCACFTFNTVHLQYVQLDNTHTPEFLVITIVPMITLRKIDKQTDRQIDKQIDSKKNRDRE